MFFEKIYIFAQIIKKIFELHIVMDIIEKKNIETLERLRIQLLKTERWPLKYMFKFIVPNSDGRVNTVVGMLPQGGQTSFKPSKDLHYVSVTHVNFMPSADSIIEMVTRATSVDGVISL